MIRKDYISAITNTDTGVNTHLHMQCIGLLYIRKTFEFKKYFAPDVCVIEKLRRQVNPTFKQVEFLF